MVAHLLRLRLALLLGALRGRNGVRRVLSVVLVALAACGAGVAVLSLATAPVEVSRTVIVLAVAAVFLGYLVVPFLVGAVDPLDPRRFAVLGVDERRIAGPLLIGSTVGLPSLALLAVIVCVTIVGIQAGSPGIAAVVAGAIGYLSIQLAARIGMALGALLLPERRPRELTALFALAAVVVAFPIALFFASMSWDGRVPALTETGATTVGMTPFGASTGFVFALADGDVAAAVTGGIVALATLAVLWLAWAGLVRLLLTRAERPASAPERSGLGWFAVMPSNAFGAIAARSLIYWLRDRRYLVNVLVVPVAGALTVLPLLAAGVSLPIALLVPVPVMALFFGWLPHNDLAYDSTAFWLHVASDVRGIADRAGRLVPIVLVAVPVLAIATPVSLVIGSRWELLPALVGVAASLFLSALGLSSIMSVVAPYLVSRPGDSPFQQPQRQAARGVFGQAIALLGAVVLSAPAIWLLVLTTRDVLGGGTGGAAGIAAFWTGLGVGTVALVLGLLSGAAVFARSGERLMEFVESA